MNSIRTKITLLTVCTVIIALSIATAIGVTSIKNLGRNDADQMLHLTASTGAMNLESYFESVEHTVETVATLVQDSFDGMLFLKTWRRRSSAPAISLEGSPITPTAC